MNIRKSSLLMSLLIIYIALFFGCAGNKLNLESDFNDKELFEMGLKEFNDKNYQKARMYFNRIETYFPQSSYIQRARLLRADSHFNQKSVSGYIEAQAEYQTYLNLYPTADNLDYVRFQIAMCSYKQAGKPNRDKTGTLKAFTEFKDFLEKYPNSDYVEEAQKYYQDVSDRLAEHEFKVGRFYFKRRRYPAAIERLSYSLQEYPSSLLDGQIHLYLGKALLMLGQEEEAQAYLTQLLERFPNSELAIEAKELLANISDEETPS